MAASTTCRRKHAPRPGKRSRKGFKAGSLGGHVGVKFKLASAGLQKARRKLEKEYEKRAQEQHKARMELIK